MSPYGWLPRGMQQPSTHLHTCVYLQEMDQELERYHKSNAQLDLNISDLKLKQEGLKREVLAQRAALERSHASIKEFHHDIHDVVQSLQVRHTAGHRGRARGALE